MKASDLLRGYLQIRRVRLPLAGALPSQYLPGFTPEQKEADLEAWRAEHPGQPDPPAPPEVGLLPLEPGDRGIVMERGREYARSHGLDSPSEGDDLYEYGKAIHTCLRGVVDPESDPSSPEPFFDGGIEQLLRLRELGRDGILVLAEMHDAFTSEISGQVHHLTDERYQEVLEEVTGPSGFPFWCSLRPGAQWSFMRTTAFQLRGCLKLRSSGGSSSDAGSRSGQTRSSRSQGSNPESRGER